MREKHPSVASQTHPDGGSNSEPLVFGTMLQPTEGHSQSCIILFNPHSNSRCNALSLPLFTDDILEEFRS